MSSSGLHSKSEVRSSRVSRTTRTERDLSWLATFPEENPNPVLRVALDAKLLYANPAGAPLLAAWGCKIGDCLPENSRASLAGALKAGQVTETEELWGERVWSLAWMSVPSAGYVNVYGRDITERKRAEENLRRLATVVRDSNDAITIQDFEGWITAWNSGAELMYGYSEEEALLENIERLTVPGKVEEQKDFTRRLMAGEMITSFETQRLTKGGRVLDVWLTVTKLMDDAGKPIGIASTERDITERKRAEEALIASELRYRRLFETAKDGILILDSETGKVQDANQFLIELLGFSHEQFFGKSIWDLGFLKDILANKANFLELQEKGYVRYDDLPLQTADGRQINVEFVSNVYETNHKKVIQCNIRDITERKQVQKALELSTDALRRRNVELHDFYHTVSHELKTPLTSAREFVSILLDGIAGPLTDEQKQYLQLIRESCDQLHFCVKDLLEATRLDTGKLEVHLVDTSVETLVADVVGAMAPVMQAKGIDLRCEISPALARVLLDRRRITQVCTNLLGNALKFTPAGGVVTVRVGNDPDNPDLIRFAVSDTGCGISPEHLDGIFDKLYQVRETSTSIEGGMGLGLYIASAIVRLHGGRMWVKSTVDHGSIFYFTVPKRVRPPRYHILFVDDDRYVQETVRDVLEPAGFEVSIATDGVTALEMMQDQAVDLAIVDLCLQGMPGPVLIGELRKKWGDLPLVIYTAYPENKLMAQAMKFSPLTLLIKTCPMKKLMATVRELLEARVTQTARKADHDLSAVR